MAIDFSKRASIPRHVLFRELEGEAVLLNLDSEHYFGLDSVGTRMWVVISQSDSIEKAFQALTAEYEVEPIILREDMDDLLEQLVEQGLLEFVDVTP